MPMQVMQFKTISMTHTNKPTYHNDSFEEEKKKTEKIVPIARQAIAQMYTFIGCLVSHIK